MQIRHQIHAESPKHLLFVDTLIAKDESISLWQVAWFSDCLQTNKYWSHYEKITGAGRLHIYYLCPYVPADFNHQLQNVEFNSNSFILGPVYKYDTIIFISTTATIPLSPIFHLSMQINGKPLWEGNEGNLIIGSDLIGAKKTAVIHLPSVSLLQLERFSQSVYMRAKYTSTPGMGGQLA